MSISAASNPTPEAIRAARRALDLSAAEAGALVYTTARSWLRWEAGEQDIDPARWHLFCLLTQRA